MNLQKIAILLLEERFKSQGQYISEYKVFIGPRSPGPIYVSGSL